MGAMMLPKSTDQSIGRGALSRKHPHSVSILLSLKRQKWDKIKKKKIGQMTYGPEQQSPAIDDCHAMLFWHHFFDQHYVA